MLKVNSSEDLLHHIKKMNRENSVSQFVIPGKGKFTIVLQEDHSYIEAEINADEELNRMINESRVAYKEGKVQSTTELINSFSVGDFEQ